MGETYYEGTYQHVIHHVNQMIYIYIYKKKWILTRNGTIIILEPFSLVSLFGN